MTEVVDEYSVNGDSSFRLSSPPDSTYNYNVKTTLETDNLNGKTVTVSCDCFNLSVDPAKLQFKYGTHDQVVTIPPTSSFTSITLTQAITEDLTEIQVLWFFNNTTNDNKLYIDNICVTIQ